VKKYPANEPEYRLSRIRRMMEERELDAMVFYSCQWKIEVIHYVANLRILGEEACMVLPRVGAPTLYISEPWDLERAREESWVEDIVVCTENMTETAGKRAASYGKNIGIVGVEQMKGGKYRALMRGLSGKRITNEYAALDEICKVKTPWEIEIMRKCAKLADDAYLAEINALRVGVSEFELISELEYAMKKGGADENFQMIGMGTNLPSMNRAKENYLKMGDFVLTEITPIIGCITYATQLCRTVKMGEATPLEREKHKLLCDALEYALSKAKAGIRAKDLVIWQNEVIGAAGYEKYCHPPYMRSRGHNFGLGLINLSEDNEEILHEDTILVVHPNQMIPEVGYLVCGVTVRFTKDGVERLSSLSTEMYEAIPN
jgi:Xaa-Pro dipeptidase